MSYAKRRPWIRYGCAAMVLAGTIGLAAMAVPNGAVEPAAADEAAATEAQEGPSTGVLLAPVVDRNRPVIIQLSDGTLIQRTPDENVTPTLDATAVLHHPEENVPSNTYFVRADARGCNACHEDLAQTLVNMPYGHHPLINNMGLEASVDQCLQCHRIGGSTVQTVPGEFGTMIHGIHMGIADCWNCHDATDNGDASGGQGDFDYSQGITGTEQGSAEDAQQVVLWDQTKHNKLRGITDIDQADISGDFSWNTDELTSNEDMFDVTWATYPNDYERINHAANGDPTDQETFDTWTISVTGEVGQEMTWTLPELIEQAPSETFVAKLNCTVNPVNGPYVGQAEYTGIPVSWLLEQAGISEDAANVSFCTPDGPYGSDSVADIMNPDNVAYLAYEMNGEPLPWSQGFPVMYIRGGVAAYVDVKTVTELQVTSGEGSGYGSGFRFGLEYVKPSVGIYNLHEGQIIQTGETHTFSGYVDAYNEKVVALEVSMDRGKTWKSFPIEDADVDRLITWYFDFTPEQDGAYCLAVRGVTENGTRTEEYVEKMVVAKSEMPEPDLIWPADTDAAGTDVAAEEEAE